MLARLLHTSVILIALPVWLFGLVLPMAWLVVAGIWQVIAPSSESSLGYAWQLRLYASSLLLMVLAGLVAMVLATIAAYTFARIGRLAVVWISVGALVVPPLVYGYLWFLTFGDRILLQSLPVPFNLPVPNLGNLALASWAIGLWLWPIPALILTAGWQWAGRPAWLLARLDAGDSRAFLRAALPATRPYLLAAWAVCMLLAAQEYAVPALFSVQTWQTQWLELARAGIPLGRLAIAALPPAVLLVVLIGLVVRFWRSVESLGPSDLGIAILRPRARLYAWATLLIVIGLATIVPSIGAVRSLTKALQFSPQRFHDELVNTPIIMVSVATMALAAAILALPGQCRRRSGNDWKRVQPPNSRGGEGETRRGGETATTRNRVRPPNDRAEDKERGRNGNDWKRVQPPDSNDEGGSPLFRTALIRGLRAASTGPWHPAFGRIMLGLAIAAWALPVSLIAESGKQAETAAIALLYRIGQQIPLIGNMLSQADSFSWLNVLLWVSVLAGRMLPIVWILTALVARSLPANLAEQAQVDGATRSQILQRILLPLLAPAAAAGWLICGLLVATDSVAATMLQPAGFQVLAVSMLNQMHYGRDGDIVATCLMTLAAAALAAMVAAFGLGRTSRDDG